MSIYRNSCAQCNTNKQCILALGRNFHIAPTKDKKLDELEFCTSIFTLGGTNLQSEKQQHISEGGGCESIHEWHHISIMADKPVKKLDIHCHILPKEWPDLEKVNQTV